MNIPLSARKSCKSQDAHAGCGMQSIYDRILLIRAEKQSKTLGYWGKTSIQWVTVGVSSRRAPPSHPVSGKGFSGPPRKQEAPKESKTATEQLKEGRNPLPSDYIRQEICRAVRFNTESSMAPRCLTHGVLICRFKFEAHAVLPPRHFNSAQTHQHEPIRF